MQAVYLRRRTPKAGNRGLRMQGRFELTAALWWASGLAGRFGRKCDQLESAIRSRAEAYRQPCAFGIAAMFLVTGMNPSNRYLDDSGMTAYGVLELQCPFVCAISFSSS